MPQQKEAVQGSSLGSTECCYTALSQEQVQAPTCAARVGSGQQRRLRCTWGAVAWGPPAAPKRRGVQRAASTEPQEGHVCGGRMHFW